MSVFAAALPAATATAGRDASLQPQQLASQAAQSPGFEAPHRTKADFWLLSSFLLPHRLCARPQPVDWMRLRHYGTPAAG